MGGVLPPDLRPREFGRLDRAGETYLDYTGAALYPASLVAEHARFLAQAVLGNPHSAHRPSARAGTLMAEARTAVLAFFDANPDEYTVVFTANASAACRLVGESFPFAAGSAFRLSADNHNSVNGLRPWARARGARVVTDPVGPDLRPGAYGAWPTPDAPSLWAFPAQSNFSGVRHDLETVAAARARGWRVLLDAAAFVPTSPLSLRRVGPDFVAVSFYKMFGYPTGVGALIARHDAIVELQRPWFAGGTVDYVSLAHGRHQLAAGPEAFEDGTPDFLAIAALASGLGFLDAIGMEAIATHVHAMTGELLDRLTELRHANGAPLVRIHGPSDMAARGGTVAFSVLDPSGRGVPYDDVERAAADNSIAVRGGCFCNPGCAEAAFGLDADDVPACLDTLPRGRFTPAALRDCLGGRPVGAVRASVGLPTVRHDLNALRTFLHAHYCNRSLAA